MAKALGIIAGFGMLALIGMLICAFLFQIRVIRTPSVFLKERKRDAAKPRRPLLRRVLKTVGAVAAAVCVNALAAGLFIAVLFSRRSDFRNLSSLFPGPMTQRMVQAMRAPEAAGFFGWIAMPGVLLGKAIGAQPFACGALISILSTAAALCLITARFQQITDEDWTDGALMCLLCLPGFIVFFLPGWPAAALLVIAALFCFLGSHISKKPKPRHGGNTAFSAFFGWIVGTEAALSCAVIAGMVWGRIG